MNYVNSSVRFDGSDIVRDWVVTSDDAKEPIGIIVFCPIVKTWFFKMREGYAIGPETL